jgi:hypothetical protein
VAATFGGKMTPSKTVKLAGLKSLAEMSRLAKVPVSTLNYQFKHCPELWDMNLDRALTANQLKGK